MALSTGLTLGRRHPSRPSEGPPNIVARRFASSCTALSAARPFHGSSGVNRFKDGFLHGPTLNASSLLFGINDLGIGRSVTPPTEQVTATQLVEGFSGIAIASRRNGVTTIGTTVTRFEAALPCPGFHTPEKELVRTQVNECIRTSRTFDHIVDFDSALRSSKYPSRLDKKFDSGDHLPPNDAGNRPMAAAFDLGAFE
jgi:hypothetical protein